MFDLGYKRFPVLFQRFANFIFSLKILGLNPIFNVFFFLYILKCLTSPAVGADQLNRKILHLRIFRNYQNTNQLWISSRFQGYFLKKRWLSYIYPNTFVIHTFAINTFAINTFAIITLVVITIAILRSPYVALATSYNCYNYKYLWFQLTYICIYIL